MNKAIFQYAKKAHWRLFLGILMLQMSLSSCKKFVQIDPPANLLVTKSVFADNVTATSAQLAVYIQMFGKPTSGESFAIARTCGLLSDELQPFGIEPVTRQLYTNSLTSSALPNSGLSGYGEWSTAYNYINEEDAILENLNESSGVDAAVKKQLTGEAKFVRAFWLFYLANMYGDVPMSLTTDYETNVKAARTPKDQVYLQVISDLLSAQSLLSTNYVDGTSIGTTSEKVRPTSWAATALLARVYLYTKQYAKAEAAASSVISGGVYTLCPDPNNVFLKNSSEAIWQLMVPTPTSNYSAPDGNTFIIRSTPSTSNTGSSVGISIQLLNAFEPNDTRSTKWIGKYTAGSPAVTYYFPLKYKTYSGSSSSATEYVMVLRLAELFLIRAEAEANGAGSGLSGAVADLNMIRTRAGLPNTTATTQADLQSAIIHERQVELFTEWGHRWMDLVRTGAIETVMGSPGFVTQAKGGNWASYKQLLPIPQSEIILDPNLTQNAGY